MGQKGKSVLLRLVSEAGTGFFYTTRKNPVKTPHKLAFVKYDPRPPPRPLHGEGCLGEVDNHARERPEGARGRKLGVDA